MVRLTTIPDLPSLRRAFPDLAAIIEYVLAGKLPTAARAAGVTVIIIIIIHARIRVTLSQKYVTGALYKVNDAFTVTVQMLAFMSGHHQRMP